MWLETWEFHDAIAAFFTNFKSSVLGQLCLERVALSCAVSWHRESLVHLSMLCEGVEICGARQVLVDNCCLAQKGLCARCPWQLIAVSLASQHHNAWCRAWIMRWLHLSNHSAIFSFSIMATLPPEVASCSENRSCAWNLLVLAIFGSERVCKSACDSLAFLHFVLHSLIYLSKHMLSWCCIATFFDRFVCCLKRLDFLRGLPVLIDSLTKSWRHAWLLLWILHQGYLQVYRLHCAMSQTLSFCWLIFLDGRLLPMSRLENALRQIWCLILTYLGMAQSLSFLSAQIYIRSLFMLLWH